MGVSFRSGHVPLVFEDLFGRPAGFQAVSSCEGELMKGLSPFLVCLASFLLAPPPSWSQRGMPADARSSKNAEIIVQVRNPDGTAAPFGIHLRLEVAGGSSIADCATEGAGRCRFVPGGAGRYVVRVKQFGYKEVTTDVDLVDTLQAYVTVELRPDSETAFPDSQQGIASVSSADLAVPEKARAEF